MIDLLLPRRLDTLEIAVRLGRDVTRRGSLISLHVEGEEAEYVIPGWPVHPPLGLPAKQISLGDKGDIQRFATIRAASLAGCRLKIDLITEEGRPAAIAAVGVLGKSLENRAFAWRFEV